MVTLIEITDPFGTADKAKVHRDLKPGLTVRAYCQAVYGSAWREFDAPTIILVNNAPVLREQWDNPDVIKDGDFITVSPVVAGFVAFLIVGLIIALAALVIVATLNRPKIPGQVPEPDPVYNLNGQKNQMRLTYPIEVGYGRCRLWPSYAAKSYNQYIDNNQWQFQLFCIGQGEYTVHETRIEDTQIGSFNDIQWAFYGPNTPVTLFPDNVTTSIEVSNIELFGPNEPDYPAGGYSGPYVINSAFTTITKIEVDFVLTAGLYRMDKKGRIQTLQVTAQIYYQAIDDDGDAIGGWILLETFDKTLSSTTPQRFTISSAVAEGRYQIRARRTNDKNTSVNAANTLVWESVRGFGPSVREYGNVTMLAVKARASNNLNDTASNRINVIATRKLPTYVDGAWTAPVTTRSIAWAFCDIVRNSNYGGRMTDTYVDIAKALEQNAVWTARGDTFDWVFDQKTTIWDALRAVCAAGRAVPMLNGSRVSLVRDAANVLPIAMFTPGNFTDFKWDIKLSDINEYDGLEVEYQDENTFKPETLLCTMPGELGENPDKMTISGVTKRAQAFREGNYQRALSRYVREQIKFKTGYEGLIPLYGDLILVGCDIPRWGLTGYVKSITGGNTVVLSEPVEFIPGETHQLALRKKDGSRAGPYTVTAGPDEYTVVTSATIAEDFYFDRINEPPLYIFGKSEVSNVLCRVIDARPAEGENIEITAALYSATVFSFDELAPPALVDNALPPVPPLPAITGFSVASQPGNARLVVLTWNPSLGASSYLIETSYDGEAWNSIARVTSTTYTLSVLYGYLYIRVAGINLGIGAWAEWEGEVGVSTDDPVTVTGLATTDPWLGLEFETVWNAMSVAAQFKIKVFQDAGATLKRETLQAGNAFIYDYDMAVDDGLPVKRSLRLEVTALNGLGAESPAPAVLDVYNPPPDVLTGLSSTLTLDDPDFVRYLVQYTPSDAEDLDFYRVYGSTTNGFTPGPSNLQYEGPATGFNIDVEKVAGAHPAFYWRACAVDVWGDDVVNMSAQQTIAAYP
jgi:hypothetical protein